MKMNKREAKEIEENKEKPSSSKVPQNRNEILSQTKRKEQEKESHSRQLKAPTPIAGPTNRQVFQKLEGLER